MLRPRLRKGLSRLGWVLLQAIDSSIYSCVGNASCRYEYRYGDLSSTSGDFVYDVLTLNYNFATSHFAFGCGHSNRGNFNAVGGLVGLGLGSFSLPSQINDTVPDVFSYCLLSTYPASTKTSPLFFGEVPPITNVVYTPMIQNPANPTFYYVGLQGITLNGQQLFIPIEAFAMDASGGGGVIVDSGTTLTLLNENAYNVLLQVSAKLPNHPKCSHITLAMHVHLHLMQRITRRTKKTNLSIPTIYCDVSMATR